MNGEVERGNHIIYDKTLVLALGNLIPFAVSYTKENFQNTCKVNFNSYLNIKCSIVFL